MAGSKVEDGVHARLRQIPSIEELLGRPGIADLEGSVGRPLLLDAAREATEVARRELTAGNEVDLTGEGLESEIRRRLEAELLPSLVPVINATGVVLHTNLGRAPLAREAAERLAQVAERYSNLEYDLERGERGKRDAHTGRLLARLVGAESALVVNNNAAALFLALNALAEGGEVVVSRGELVEIGDSFRIPDICAKSGAVLREVGTTNRTRLSDYASALNERTRALLRVHPSNFRMVGFTERPPLEGLVELSRRHNLSFIEDLGSGCLEDLSPAGLSGETPVSHSVQAGVDVVTFSGDKLFGGPQAGILVGRSEILQRIRRNPLFRVLRVDKLVIVALEATAQLYRRRQLDAIPTLRMIGTRFEALGSRAENLANRLRNLPGLRVGLQNGESVAGGGSTPGQTLPTPLVAVKHDLYPASLIAERLRRRAQPIVARVESGQVLVDLRTVLNSAEEDEIVRAFADIGAGSAKSAGQMI